MAGSEKNQTARDALDGSRWDSFGPWAPPQATRKRVRKQARKSKHNRKTLESLSPEACPGGLPAATSGGDRRRRPASGVRAAHLRAWRQ